MLSTEIVLRPRFQIDLKVPSSQLMERFKTVKKSESKFHISCLDDHIFIKLPKEEQHFWSPQLHLEISENSENSCTIYGFFGPNPTAWTMFIFFHVAVGILFMVNATWLYSNFNLGNSIVLQITIAIVLILTWILLYIAGRIGKKKGKPGMQELYGFMMETIK
ncbi:GTP-binding protein [Aequorivita sp. F47161]|uniref:GTP-binding protein n=1 Tax=Aequorivita vitellina TaxID=2874475 RepID=A0A9X1QYJ0_9FLAO|nr:GTP-binding protein [Aequorivita vitellina]MCG2419727.1 GTP-binding protein [Aequorivita vitellina]